MTLRTALACASLATAATLCAAQQPQGISKNEILVGTIQDLSGPLSGYGKQARAGMQMALEEINETGGIHGRKITLLVEDSGYDPKKAVLAAQKLVNDKASFKRGTTDFSSQVAKMQASGCELVVLGTIIRETVGAIATARKLGYNPVFLGSSAAYTELVPKLGGKAMEGFYATMTAHIPYMDDASPVVRRWVNKYKTQFNEDPSTISVFGYTTVNVFANAMRDAGERPNTSKFIRAMEVMKIPGDMFGSPALKFTPTRRLGSDDSRMAQIQDGRWKVVSEYSNQ